MPGSSTTPGRPGARDSAPARVAFRYRTASAPGMSHLSRLNGWPVRSPVNASPTPSRSDCARLGADVVRYSFIVMDLHHLLLAGLPAHSKMTPSRHAPHWTAATQMTIETHFAGRKFLI